MLVVLFGSRPPKELTKAARLGQKLYLERWYEQYMPVLEEAIAQSGFTIYEVVGGMADGFDELGKRWAKANNIPFYPKPANWYPKGRNGPLDRGAGIKRNCHMGDIADAAVGVNIDRSPGTTHMENYMKKLNKPVYVKHLKELA